MKVGRRVSGGRNFPAVARRATARLQHDPAAPAIKVYRDGAFHDYQPQAEQLPRASSSIEWYRGWRDHLEFAEIG